MLESEVYALICCRGIKKTIYNQLNYGVFRFEFG